ncbi:uncharacterized protein J3R85_005559 [Psidium guajava]|nr:uncharacterized protein J3R85_005559 [Psidium guajava]
MVADGRLDSSRRCAGSSWLAFALLSVDVGVIVGPKRGKAVESCQSDWTGGGLLGLVGSGDVPQPTQRLPESHPPEVWAWVSARQVFARGRGRGGARKKVNRSSVGPWVLSRA